MLKFDPQTYSSWESRNIENISIEFISSWCEGTSIVIHENNILENYIPLQTIGTTTNIYIESTHQKILETAYITHTGEKWIMKSESILTRCWCGKSFGIKTGDNKIDKLKLLKSKLSKSKSNHH